jgi:TolB-like protein
LQKSVSVQTKIAEPLQTTYKTTSIMKKIFLIHALVFALGLLPFSNIHAQALKKSNLESIAVIDIDVRGHKMNGNQVNQFIINELMRVNVFEVMDRYDIEYISKRDTLNFTGCFSKICLKEFGEKLGVDFMFTGSISQLGDNLNITLRILNVKTGVFEQVKIKEFLVIPGTEMQMIRIVINEMFGLPNDQDILKKLTQKAEFDNTVNNPYTLRLRSDGPRMGMTYATGYLESVLTRTSDKGGYGGNPYMFQFGYQFEKQYLNEGNFQALFEFIPMITGLDQGQFIPSVTLLNGLRNNTNGWEFAFGPTFSLSKFANGYFADGNPKNDFIVSAAPGTTLEDAAKAANSSVESRPDSRGTTQISYGFLFAAGKTIKSGKLNLPVNIFVVPGKNGLRFGISLGWNGKDRYESNRDN